MSYSIEDVQEAILADLKAAFEPVHNVVEQAIPNTWTVKRQEGTNKIVPYVALQFGDTNESGAKSMIGPEGDDYAIPIYIQTVAGTPSVARRLANKVIRVMLGNDYPWSGHVSKRPGGGMWPIVSSNGATEAYQFPASFSVPVQFHYDPETP